MGVPYYGSTTPGFTPSGAANKTSAAGASSDTITGLTPSTAYYVVVRARDQAGNVDTNTVRVAARTFVSFTTNLSAAYASGNCGCHNGGSQGFDSASRTTILGSQPNSYNLVFAALPGLPYASPVLQVQAPASVPWSASADTGAPTAPGSPSASASSSTVVGLSWTAGSDAVTGTSSLRYMIWANTVSGGHNWAYPLAITAAGATSYNVTGLRPGTTYYFVIRTLDAWRNPSNNTTEVNATTGSTAPSDTTAPSAPSSPGTAVVSGSTITVSWTASTDNVSGAGNLVYGVWVAQGATPGTSAIPDYTTANGATSITIDWLDKWTSQDTPYTFIIRAMDEAGNWSANSTSTTGTILNATYLYGSGGNSAPKPYTGGQRMRSPFFAWTAQRMHRDWIAQGAPNN